MKKTKCKDCVCYEKGTCRLLPTSVAKLKDGYCWSGEAKKTKAKA